MAQRNELMTDADLIDAIQALEEQEPNDEVKDLLSKLFIFGKLKNIFFKLFYASESFNANFSGTNNGNSITSLTSTNM